MDGTEVYSRESASDQLRGLVAACIIMMVLTTVFAALRFVSRISLKSVDLGWDDFLLVPAYMFAIGTAAAGLGEHESNLGEKAFIVCADNDQS